VATGTGTTLITWYIFPLLLFQ